MGLLDYVSVPSYASPLRAGSPTSSRPAPRLTTALPHPRADDNTSTPTSAHASSPALASPGGLNLPALLLSSALPAGTTTTAHPRKAGGAKLLSAKDALSIPITTVNFRRFVSKCGPVFWVQDRVEEVVMWRRGWKLTAVWAAAYAFLCYYPRLVLLIPHAILLGVLLATHPTTKTAASDGITPMPPVQPGEGSVDWQANLQAIQNLMGAYSDAHDAVLPLLPHLTHHTRTSTFLLPLTVLSALLLLPILSVLPLRPTFLVLGLAPLMLTHPWTQSKLLPALAPHLAGVLRRVQARVQGWADDGALPDAQWRAQMRAVSLWENERWALAAASTSAVHTGSPATHGLGFDESVVGVRDSSVVEGGGGRWGKAHLRSGERAAWTRGRDGWTGADGDVSSNLTFALEPGWRFVQTEDWRADYEGAWAECGADDAGWVYTNDAWQDARAVPREEWMQAGMTRRRRWVRRVYYDAALAAA